jgi:hypothetical protein
MLSEGLLATMVTGGVGLLGVLVSRFKCIVRMDGCCSCRSCKWGLLDASIVDNQEVTLKTANINGTDVLYKSKNFIQIDSDDEDGQMTTRSSRRAMEEERDV